MWLFIGKQRFYKPDGRCWISSLEVRENDKNSGIIDFSKEDALAIDLFYKNNSDYWTKERVRYEKIPPKELIDGIESYK